MAPSPYLPATRRYFNPIYLNIESLPEFVNADVKKATEIAGLAAKCQPMNKTAELLDRDLVWSAKKSALELLLSEPLTADRQAAFDSYTAAEGEGLTRFATWCVLAELYGISNGDWAADLRRPDGAGIPAFVEANATRIDFYAKLQWLLDEQFATAQAAAKAAGMAAGIVHDLAVGVHPEGADAWALQDVLAHNVSVGAPPDMFNQMGQDWSQPPWRPDALVENAYLPYRDMLRTILRHSGGIRVDHALGLFRLWWIPTGLGAAHGTFVKYDHDALVGILALEAQRVGAFVVGEDLGTVEPWIQDYLKDRGIAGTSILFFERDSRGPVAPENWRELCLATVTVHDIPPSAGFLDGEHIRMRHDLGLLAGPVEREWDAHAREMAGWDELLNQRGWMQATNPASPTVQEKVEGLHRIIAHTPCKLLAVALPDLVGDMRAQNQPGTDQEYPNWRIPTCHADGTPLLIEDFENNPEIRERAGRLIAAVTETN
jgi:4-alpha-glucanotransferase